MEPPSLVQEEIEQVEGIIKRLHAAKDKLPDNGTILSQQEVEWLITKAQKVFAFQPMLVELEAPVAICGDTHGQFYDLLRIFSKGKPPPETRYLFLGDYVDRGPHGVEVISLMLAYKIRYWNDFYVLRGNHETAAINRVYGFYDECRRKFGEKSDIYKRFNECFDYMPLAALINEGVLCMHGGISPDLTSWNQISDLPRPLSKIDGGLACDLLWADPDRTVTGFQKSTRGISYLFGQDAVGEFCKRMDVQMIIRAHQVVQQGYELFPGSKLMTVFSAPDYCNQFGNAGGYVEIKRDLVMVVKQLLSKKESRNFDNSKSLSASAK